MTPTVNPRRTCESSSMARNWSEHMNVSWSRGKYSPVLTYVLLWTAFVIFMLEYAGMIDLVRGLPGWR